MKLNSSILLFGFLILFFLFSNDVKGQNNFQSQLFWGEYREITGFYKQDIFLYPDSFCMIRYPGNPFDPPVHGKWNIILDTLTIELLKTRKVQKYKILTEHLFILIPVNHIKEFYVEDYTFEIPIAKFLKKKSFYINGMIESIIERDFEGRRNGKSSYYTITGEIFKEEFYENDVLKKSKILMK